MRANINLDTKAHSFASAYANAKGIPLGAAISELLRKAEEIQGAALSSKLKKSKRGYLVKARTGRTVAPEMVRESSEDDLG